MKSMAASWRGKSKMPDALQAKIELLKSRLRELGSVVIGFSGGIDSTLILKLSAMNLGPENVWAVTANSESLLPEELEECRKLADEIGILKANFIEIKTNELANPNYKANPIDRCFYCKHELFSRLKEIAAELGAKQIIDGSNADDLSDWRPGRKAAGKLGVVSPLAEAGITKSEIREIARDLGLPNWDKPALACLSSRIPYGSEVTAEKLKQIGEAERFLHSLGFTQLRVRHHDKIARLEFLKEEMSRLQETGLADKIASKLKEIGFTYITVDLQGYRSGSMNDTINKGRV
jgi:pyridinium-3,5-biscarboxylic acid mononucleotide sulfurtransferase